MKRLRITHLTEYFYRVPVRFGPHRFMIRPREDHELRIVDRRREVSPDASIEWVRDIYGNSIAILEFAEPSDHLRLLSEVTVEIFADTSPECPIKSAARHYPFQYGADEQIEIMAYRIPSYPHDGPALNEWLRELYTPGDYVGTWDLLTSLNSHIFASLAYQSRDEAGVQLPCETLARKSGTCRDYAVLMMEAVRHWGFASRFVSGYIQLNEGQHGATHAWTEVYLPGAGWRGFDPTNNKLAGPEHISVAVARSQEKAMPISGSWDGPADAFDRMNVSVQVVEC